MPGMIQADQGSSTALSATTSAGAGAGAGAGTAAATPAPPPPLQSFSQLSLASIRTAILSPLDASNCWLEELKSEERGLCLIQLLLACAKYVCSGNMEQTNVCLEQISVLASLTGDPMQRLATYFMEGLAARITKSWPGLHRALNSTHLQASISDLVLARHVFFSLFPYLKFAFNAVHLTILESMEKEKVVHIIDLDASEPAQWIPFLQSLSQRPGGPPHLKMTGINEKKEVVQQTAAILTEEAERLDIPFQFNQLVTRLDHLTDDMLAVKTGDAVAISAVLQFHALLAEEQDFDNNCGGGGGGGGRVAINRKRPREYSNTVRHEDLLLRSMFNMNNHHVEALVEKEGSVRRAKYSPSEIEAAISSRRSSLDSGKGISSRRSNLEVMGLGMSSGRSNLEGMGMGIDRFLRMLRGLSPKVMVVVEQESNHNGGHLMDRFVEALYYYSAMFDSLESTLPQQSIERVTLEKYLFGKQIHNIVACEGSERVERHEKLQSWMQRFDRAGFAHLPLGYTALMHANRLLHTYSSDSHRLLHDNGCLTICWEERPLYSVSAWQSA